MPGGLVPSIKENRLASGKLATYRGHKTDKDHRT